jgi:hypothetical protein
LLTPFVRAWDARRSSSSEAKIAAQFDRAPACRIPTSEGEWMTLLFASEPIPGADAHNKAIRLYVKHGLGATPDPARLQWTQTVTDRTTRLHVDTLVVPRFASRRDMQGFAITEFTLDHALPQKLQIGDRQCDSHWGMRSQ